MGSVVRLNNLLQVLVAVVEADFELLYLVSVSALLNCMYQKAL